jgi:hypothetical protein
MLLFQGRFSVAMAGSLLLASSLISMASSLAFQRSSCSNRRMSSASSQGFQCRPQLALFGDEKSVSEYSDFIEVDEADFVIAADNDDDQELLVRDEDDDEDEHSAPAEEEKAVVNPDSFVFIPKAKAAPESSSSQSTPRPKSQFAALAPGTVVHIKVGDITLARKAWKKRRRSGSPLLVPCSVLNVDRQSTIRWNLIYLLEKFGTSTSGQGIRISLGELARRQRTHLKSSLTQQAEAMGFATARELVENLLNKKAQETYGVKLVYINNENGVITSDGGDDTESNILAIEAPLSRFRAQKRANEAAILQFGDEDQKEDTLQHTGIVRNRRQVSEEDSNMYQLQPLSAALRVNQEDVDTGHIQDGSMHAAVVFTYDSQGDGGAPMLTLSLNPGRNQVRDRLKIAPSDHKYTPILNPKYMLKELKAGDGPIEGKVIRFVKGGALLDCGVGRKVNNRDVPDPVRVFGLLRFKDALAAEKGDDPRYDFSKFVDDDVEYDDDAEEEDWDEILNIDDLDLDRDLDEDYDEDEDEVESTQGVDDGNAELSSEDDEAFIDSEDITDLFTTNADGSLTYTDPETGEITIVNDADDDDDEFDEEDSDDRENYRINRGSDTAEKDYRPKRPAFKATTGLKSKRLNVGDRVEVFVKGVSKQSNQLMVTMNPSVQGMTAKDMKRETGVSKKLNRLAKQIGGMHRIRELQGQECDGVVKATSVAGDWLYVQPSMDSLPVGVATVPAELYADLTKGDKVRIQLQGVDEDRGQLAMLILEKL